MILSIGETARLMGVSVRTLRYYDEIGLLRPSEVTAAGYREYGDEAIAQLQQVLYFREMGVPLGEIAALLSRPDYDRREALAQHREWLLLKRRRLDELIRLVDETIGGKPMTKPNEIVDMEQKKAQYAAEAAEKWGATEAYRESEKRHAAYTGTQEQAIQEEAEEIFRAFAAAMDADPAGPEAQALVKRWQDHITARHYPCTKEILAGLGQMYDADERFREHIDRWGDGAARFMSKAIEAYCR